MSGSSETLEKSAFSRARHWRDLNRRQQIGVLVGAMVQITLAVTAWTDLAKRPASRVNGAKGIWAVIIGVNFLGPIAYFTAGQRR
ncbi:MAG TPA: PLDc N-terminal domain-containing protein [Cryobacterium sp.]|nr:PLDc N-terminal domain-containing protein [Cryobacterium sp.]